MTQKIHITISNGDSGRGPARLDLTIEASADVLRRQLADYREIVDYAASEGTLIAFALSVDGEEIPSGSPVEMIDAAAQRLDGPEGRRG